jgi:hypothetical protein
VTATLYVQSTLRRSFEADAEGAGEGSDRQSL